MTTTTSMKGAATVAVDTVHEPIVARRLVGLELLDVDLEAGVWLEACFDDGSTRAVRVLVGSGTSWGRAVRFPNMQSEAGQSLGSDVWNKAIRRRAVEALVLLAAAVRAMEGRCAA